jgi:hypothetical protein
MVGNITIFNTVANDFVGEWIIELDNDAIKHRPKGVDKVLPPICQDEAIMNDVETMVHNYMAGYNHQSTVHKWVKPVEEKKDLNIVDDNTCPYCGNSFDSKYTNHSVCGMA